MNRFLEGDTIEEIMVRNRKMFCFPMYLNKEAERQDISTLDLGAGAYNCLRRAGYRTIGDVVERNAATDLLSSKKQLMALHNMGKTKAQEILVKLFFYQFNVLPEERKKRYMLTVAAMNR